MKQQNSSMLMLLRYANPWNLLAVLMFYFLGIGVVVFLGSAINWLTFWLGLVTLLDLQVSSFLLKAYYDTFEGNPRYRNPPRTRLQWNEEEPPVEFSRPLLLQASLIVLTVGAALTFLLISRGALGFPALILLGTAFALAFFYAVPPLRLVNRGYGEFSQAILLVNLVPALAFYIQYGDLHRLLPMITFPITALYLAMSLAFGLPEYARNIKLGKKTLMLRMGWQQGIVFHNVFILSAYLMIGLAALLGLPWALTWPPLLTLPLGIYQIIQMNQIALGVKPRWRLLTLTALATMSLMTYQFTFALWTG